MASASALTGFAPARSQSPLPLLKRLINAMVASRIDAVERELRLHEPSLRALAEGRGQSYPIRLDRTALLPFTPSS